LEEYLANKNIWNSCATKELDFLLQTLVNFLNGPIIWCSNGGIHHIIHAQGDCFMIIDRVSFYSKMKKSLCFNIIVPLVSIGVILSNFLKSCLMNDLLSLTVTQENLFAISWQLKHWVKIFHSGYYENRYVTIKQNKPGLLSTDRLIHLFKQMLQCKMSNYLQIQSIAS
jgi:hypothetical protein